MTLLLNIDPGIYYNGYRAIEDPQRSLKRCIRRRKNYYIDKVAHTNDSQKAIKYLFLANLFLTIYNNRSFRKEPAQFLHRFIERWDYGAYGNEYIKQKFIACLSLNDKKASLTSGG